MTSDDPIVLQVHQDLDVDGWEDENGTVHYDDNIYTPFGVLGNLDVKLPELVIRDSSKVILVRHGFPDAWAPDTTEGVTMRETPYGDTLMTVNASNGTVVYQIDQRPVRWSDGDEIIPFAVARLIESDWESVE